MFYGTQYIHSQCIDWYSWRYGVRRASCCYCPWLHIGFKWPKTRQKLDYKTREIVWSYLYLWRFDMFWIWRARNDRKRKLFEATCMKKFLKSHNFWQVLAIWKPMCALAWLPPVLAGSRVCSVCSTGPGRQPEVRSGGGGGVVGHTVAVFENFCPKSV
jgi:hypothetical protein